MLRQDTQTRMLSDGSQLSIPVFHFTGSQPLSPSAYIQSGIHGAETQGYLVTLQLIEFFAKNPPKGNVTIVPLANPYALNCKIGEYTFGRVDPVTGDNWNRNYVDLSSSVDGFLKAYGGHKFDELVPLFKQLLKKNLERKLNEVTSYHKKLAAQLLSLAVSADVVLDLHCDTISLPYVYSPTYAMDSVTSLGIPFVIEIPHVFAGGLDEAIFCPWVELTEQYNKLNATQLRPPVEAFTVELGSQESIDIESAFGQTEGILNYLSFKGVLSWDNRKIKNSPIITCKLENFMTIYAPTGGLIINHAPLGEPRLATDSLITLNVPSLWDNSDNLIEKSNQAIQVPFDSIPITRVASSIVHEGMALMKVMAQFNKLTY